MKSDVAFFYNCFNSGQTLGSLSGNYTLLFHFAYVFFFFSKLNVSAPVNSSELLVVEMSLAALF